MKEKVLILIIGILIGAIIATVGFLIYTKVNDKSSNINNSGFEQNGMPSMPNGGMPGGDFQNDANRPSMPNGEGQNGDKPDGEPPAKPEENNTTENKTDTNTDP